MNRENLPEVVLAVTLGLLFVVVATYRTAQDPKPGVRRRAAMASLLVYAFIAAPVFVTTGMTFWLLLILLVALALPLVATTLSGRRTRDPEGAGESAVRVLVGTGLVTALLISAGETLSLLGRIDPRMVVIVIAVIAALVVVGQGLVGGSRAGSLALWLLIVPALISIALGIFLGSASAAISPIILVPPPSWAAVVVVAVGLFVIGWADNALRLTTGATGPGPWRTWLGAAVVVTAIAFGQLMFLGGAVIAPSLQFFVLPANLDALPGLAGVMLAILTVVFTALVALVLTGAADAGAAGTGTTRTWVVVVALVAAGIALFDPGLDQILVVTALAGAALVGAHLGARAIGRGVAAGLITAAIAAVLLTVTSRLELEVATLGALIVVFLVALVAARLGTPASVEPTPQEQVVAGD